MLIINVPSWTRRIKTSEEKVRIMPSQTEDTKQLVLYERAEPAKSLQLSLEYHQIIRQ